MKTTFTQQQMADILLRLRDHFNFEANKTQAEYLYKLLRPLGIFRVKSVFNHIVKNIYQYNPLANVVSVFAIAVWEQENQITVIEVVHRLNRICAKKLFDTDLIIEDIIEHIAGDIDRLRQIPPHLLPELVREYALTKTNRGEFKIAHYKFDETARLMSEIISRAEKDLATSKYSEEKKEEFKRLSREYLQGVSEMFQKYHI